MFQTVNTKILLSILVALLAIGGLLERQHEQAVRATAILKAQQLQRQQLEERDRELTKKVNESQKQHNMNPTDKHNTWKSYVP